MLNDTWLNGTAITSLPFGASGKYVYIEDCYDYAHDLIHYNNAYLAVIAACAVLLLYFLWRHGYFKKKPEQEKEEENILEEKEH